MKKSPATRKQKPFINARKLPWWIRLPIGIALVLLGVSIILRPFSSLGLLLILIAAVLAIEGIHKIAHRHTSATPILSAVVGGSLIIGGLLVIAWSGITLEVLAILVGLALLLDGVVDIASGLRGQPGKRASLVLFGLSSIIFGLLALVWPDITLLVISVLFGIKTILFGLLQIIRTFSKAQHRKTKPAGHKKQARLVWWLRTSSALILLLAAVGLFGLSSTMLRSSPTPDSFYDFSGDIPSEPGQLIKSEPYAQESDNARGWRILYATTRQDNTPAIASAFVMAPKTTYDTPRPVITWAHGTSGVVRGCAPTVLQPNLADLAESIASIPGAIDRGWVVVGTDYVGLGTPGPHPYLIGPGEARSVLDAVRAAGQIEELQLENNVTVWGHSQGGHAALWTGMIAEDYAPDIHINGVAAAAPASDLPALVKQQEESFFGKILGSFIVRAYSDGYSDIHFNDYIDPRVRVVIEEMSKRCSSYKSTQVSAILSLMLGDTMYTQSPTAGPFGKHLTENVPAQPIQSPVFIAQGLKDPLILPSIQANYVQNRCSAGQEIEYRTYKDEDHLSIAEKDSPYIDDLLAWTQNRIQGEPSTSTCAT